MQHRTLARAMLIGVAALGAWTATELIDDHTARADSPPAVTLDRPGGLVDRTAKLPPRLPQQASARAKAAVAKTTAKTPAEPAPSTPAEPEPEPSDEPTEPTPPVEAPPVELPPVELPTLPPVEVPPLPSPAPVDLPPTPRTDPLPLPPVELPPLPAVAIPGPLPVAVGPVPAAELPPTGGVVDQLIAELTAGEPVQVIPCDDTGHPQDGQTQRDNADRQPGKPTPTVSDRSPCRPQMPAVSTTGAGQVKPPPPSAADLIVADLIGSHVPPVLGRLEHARARSTIPTSRHVAIEPGPA